MKAINCTQCGATIENVSESSLVVICDYCGARIMLDQRPKPVYIRDSQPPIVATDIPIPTAKVLTIIGASVVLVPLFLLVLTIYTEKKPEPRTAYSAPSAPSSYSSPSPWTVTAEPAKPLPVVNYQPRVSWDGPNDMEHFDDPEVDISSVSDLSSDEVKKTVFKNRTVKLRVVINTEGEIDSVQTMSGHPLLVEAATRSAKNSIFASRTKPTTRILTYTFRVLPD